MTDRIRLDFELWTRKARHGGFDLSGSGDRYNRPVVRWMWEAWKQQAENINGLTAALARAQARNADLVKQCRDHDSRRTAAVAQASSLAAEVDRLNDVVSRLSADGLDAHEM